VPVSNIASPSAAQAAVTVTVITPNAAPGRFNAAVSGAVLVTGTKMPLVDAARQLLAAGADPEIVLEMHHAGSAVEALRARLSTAATLVLDENPRPRFRHVPAWDRPPPMRSQALAYGKHPSQDAALVPATGVAADLGRHGDAVRPAAGVAADHDHDGDAAGVVS
jgi:hypothetical protein